MSIFPIGKIEGGICYMEVINDGKMKAEKVLCRVFHLLSLDKPDMNEFENRIKYQKIVYLLQVYGLSVGYGLE